MPPITEKTPARQPKPPKTIDEFMTLFVGNLRAIREYYKRQPGHGVELGHLRTGEMIFGNLEAAAEYAKAGRTWEPV